MYMYVQTLITITWKNSCVYDVHVYATFSKVQYFHTCTRLIRIEAHVSVTSAHKTQYMY